MSRNYKITIQYEGTRYDGWQKQGNTDNTIQGKLERILERMAGQSVEIHGSGRTDAGVHATGQVANFHLPDDWTPEGAGADAAVADKGKRKHADAIMAYINRYLPDDIAVTAVEPVNERFHSRFHAVKKIYIRLRPDRSGMYLPAVCSTVWGKRWTWRL